MRYVIVGAGPAGINAAECLRRTDSEGEVLVVGDEAESPYSRMAIPYYLVGRVGEEGTHLRHGPGHFDKLKIGILRDRALSADGKNGRLSLERQGIVAFDRLLIATGSRPIRPPIPGLDLPNVRTCWTLDDARAIAKLAAKGNKVVLMGAGFIGSIVLEALAERGVDLTVVEMGDRMVPRMLNQAAGNMLKRWCEAKKIRVLTSAKIVAVDKGKEPPLAVRLESGEVLPAHLLVISAGVKPNVEWLQGSGVKLDKGVLVNDRLESSVPGIYAAGDVAQGRDFSTGQAEVHAIQPTATEHARIAALNMAGKEARYRGSLNMNVLDTLGLISVSFGAWMGVPGGDFAERTDHDRFRYLRLEFSEDRLVGATALGLTDHVGMIRGLIQGEIRLGAWKAKLKSDPTRLAEAYVGATVGKAAK